MTFATALAVMPYVPHMPTATGIVAPLIRLTTHLADILSDLVNEREISPTDQTAGLIQLREHVQSLNMRSPTVSDTTNEQLARLGVLVHEYAEAFPGWSRERTNGQPSEAAVNTQHVLNRIAHLAHDLDLELAGIPSDPGRDV